MLRISLYLLPLVLAVFALVDCIQTPEENVRHIPKLWWIVLIVLIWVVGPVAYLIAGRRRDAYPTRPAPRGVMFPPPDDDPDFLRGLDKGGWRSEREKREMRDKRDKRDKRDDDPDENPGGTTPK